MIDGTEIWCAQPLDGIFEVRHVGDGAYSLRAARFHELREQCVGVAQDQPWVAGGQPEWMVLSGSQLGRDVVGEM